MTTEKCGSGKSKTKNYDFLKKRKESISIESINLGNYRSLDKINSLESTQSTVTL
jgi:hypothetical protein